MSLPQAIDKAVAYVRAHPAVMTRDEVNEFKALADNVYKLAFQQGLVNALPKVPELVAEVEGGGMGLPPVQFITELNLPGDWDTPVDTGNLIPPSIGDDLPPLPERAFLVAAPPRWFHKMEVLRSLADAPTPLLERVLAVLTRPQQCFIEYLWERKTASFEALYTIPGAWRDDGSPTAVKRKVEAINDRMLANNLSVTLNIRGERVNLERP